MTAAGRPATFTGMVATTVFVLDPRVDDGDGVVAGVGDVEAFELVAVRRGNDATGIVVEIVLVAVRAVPPMNWIRSAILSRSSMFTRLPAPKHGRRPGPRSVPARKRVR